MKSKGLKIGLLVMGLFAANVYAQQSRTEKELQSIMDSLQKAHGFPGMTFSARTSKGKHIWLSTGFSELSTKTPMRPDHRMLSGSNGKTLFAAVALQMASEGKFQLDDFISTYLADESWFKALPNAQDITMRMLLNHTSGIEEYYELGDFMQLLKANPNRSFRPEDTFKYILNRPALFKAGTDWGYADTNFIILGYILEKISGKKVYDIIQQNFIKSYNLKLTEPSVKRNFKNLATGYGRQESPFPFEGAMVEDGKLVFNPQFEWAGGGFVSNVADLSKWMKILYHLKEITPEIREEMYRKFPAKTGKDHAYGLGVQIRPSRFGTTYGHSGWFPGYMTDAVYFPEIDLAVSVQLNTDDLDKIKMKPYDYILFLTEMVLKHP